MTERQRRQLLEMVAELTNQGDHQAAKVLYDEVIADFKKQYTR